MWPAKNQPHQGYGISGWRWKEGWGKITPGLYVLVEVSVDVLERGMGKLPPFVYFVYFCTGVHCLKLWKGDPVRRETPGQRGLSGEKQAVGLENVLGVFAVSGNGAVTPIVLLYFCVQQEAFTVFLVKQLLD